MRNRRGGAPRRSDGEAVERRFEIWSRSEDVAIHFNDLIMRWRLQAVGGLGALVTLGGFVIHEADTLRARYVGMVMLSGLFISGWLAVAVLDLFYYRMLLIGAVSAITKLESRMSEVKLSTEIERVCGCWGKIAPWIFYVLGMLPLIAFVAWGLYRLHSIPDAQLDAPRADKTSVEAAVQQVR